MPDKQKKQKTIDFKGKRRKTPGLEKMKKISSGRTSYKDEKDKLRNDKLKKMTP